MNEFIFAILVILLTPVYLIIKFIKGTIEIITDLSEPFTDIIRESAENMTDFWKKILTKKKRGK